MLDKEYIITELEKRNINLDEDELKWFKQLCESVDSDIGILTNENIIAGITLAFASR